MFGQMGRSDNYSYKEIPKCERLKIPRREFFLGDLGQLQKELEQMVEVRELNLARQRPGQR